MVHDFDASILERTHHRPWPMPDRAWVMSQTWHDLLFAHWPVDPAQLAGRIPYPLTLDLFDGTAWVGVIPFHMTNVSPRGVPSLPGLSAFGEINVRTYVRVDDRPGVYFFSLDAESGIAVRAARVLFNLPYYTARMSISRLGEGVAYRSVRKTNGCRAEFEGVYEPIGPSFVAPPRTLDSFLVERYCLYQVSSAGIPYRLDIHHPPWVLQKARAQVRTNSMTAANALQVEGAPSLLHFARRQDMVAWPPLSLKGER